jgi:hypothetical protein
VPVTSRFCQAFRTGTVLKVGDTLAMTFPWVIETIARARQDEIRRDVAQYRSAQYRSGHLRPGRHSHRVPGLGVFRPLRARLFGPRVALRLVPAGPPSRRGARTGN